ncbi:hypothetical protein CHS0354_033633 [Potamilus streckersoni]|uniref:BLOC-2 complex member HPS6 N-terminal domain-containing protein n=1 Tax=Potamilus streckersoni TaxID=2493646 RepID=A0AAE0SSJ7_9BIVA|nr:hypothetical protein CHS0354_033633 [Potamilus streckersoni]
MNVKFVIRPLEASFPICRPKFLEDIVNQHGTIDRIWFSPGHIFISVQEGKQLLTVDAQRLDNQQNNSGVHIILDTGSKLLAVLKGVPHTVYTVQSNGCVLCWSFKQDSGWSLSQRFDICNAPTAEVIDICYNISHNTIFWCEKRQSSSNKPAYCICRRQLKGVMQ